MSCGLPVVTSDCGGVREAVRDGVDGFVVGFRDAAAMAEALEQLWLDPALRTAMGRAAREHVRSEFSPERQVAGFLALYRSVA
jgi:glycosyltransferase involved in cell wall biosynthesis